MKVLTFFSIFQYMFKNKMTLINLKRNKEKGNKFSELKTLELWQSRSMLNPLFNDFKINLILHSYQGPCSKYNHYIRRLKKTKSQSGPEKF